ncbi:carbohydrate ABC transporter permease [Halocella sp. SP3-1]|uniref:carbohydrate ABC transporter permease n=1 Tax=Halocella sp. SP3-1 TaxID=2382161 RepID=UPI000F7513D5|nr:carbohydrate ABC transporter permease [Halocella sp. SP3-1]AZO93454.1 carbohydrate ABC transporter permease [Halocella sp. SP3-1]MTI59449.1 carbohydrate ABC transporter permease [Bacillota bacterium]
MRKYSKGIKIFGYLMMIIVVIWILAPVYWLVISSLSTQADLLVKPPDWIPDHITFKNYLSIFGDEKSVSQTASMFTKALYNSIFVSFFVTLISLLVGTLASYAFARLNFKGKKIGMLAIIATRMIPVVSLIIPIYILLNKLSLLDNKFSLIVVYLSFTLPFVVYIMSGFFQGIPHELEEAARIDGCSRIEALIRVILPLSGPGIAAVSIFSFLLAWDQFFYALILTNSYASKTVPVAITEFTGRHTINYTAMTTGGVLAAIPPMIIVIIFQRLIIKGLTSGAVKG